MYKSPVISPNVYLTICLVLCHAGSWGPDLFGSVGEDGSACLWDLRLGGSSSRTATPVRQWQAHSEGGSACPSESISFSPLSSNVVATGGADGKVKVWDLRSGSGDAVDAQSMTGRPGSVKVLPTHRNPVLQVLGSGHVQGSSL